MVGVGLPQLTPGRVFLADGGLETTLVFLQGVDLEHFAAFPLLDSEEGRDRLDMYFEPYLDLVDRTGAGLVVDTPTWRANPDWGARLGYSTAALAGVNRRAVEYAADVAGRVESPTVVNGVVGPRGDGYVVGDTMTPEEAQDYHALQVRAFKEAGAAMTTAVTFTYAAEAVGFVRAATDTGLPCAVSFTTETDGRLPSGQDLGAAVEEVDRATDAAAAYFMVNCAHPTHFLGVLEEAAPDGWLSRVRGVRANASRMSHAELDQAEELDRGDVGELAELYGRLATVLPELRVAGGCCGTDSEHLSAIADRLVR